MMARRPPLAVLCVALLAALACGGLPGCARPTSPDGAKSRSVEDEAPSGRVRVGVAASLRPLVDDVATACAREHPRLHFELESGGSQVLAHKASELGQPFDVLVLADPAILRQLQPGWTAFHAVVATDRLVVARGKGVDAGAMTRATVFDVLLADEVVLGTANPELAPLGYRTRMAWLLAEDVLDRKGLAARLGAKVDARHVYPDAAALLAPLQTGEIDYALVYAASASAAGIDFVELPLSINLGDPKQAQAYGRVEVRVPGVDGRATATRRGAPVAYAVSIATAADNPAGARALVQTLLSSAGQGLMRRRGLRPHGGEEGRWHGTPPSDLRAAVTGR